MKKTYERGLKQRRGFSLFAPLIGTVLVMSTIFMVASLIQNDVRLSRGITSSFQSTQYATQAAIIRAKARIGTLEGIRKGSADYFSLTGLSSESFGAFTCDSLNDCKSRVLSEFTSPNVLKNTMIFAMTDSLANNLVDIRAMRLEGETVGASAESIRNRIRSGITQAFNDGLFDFTITPGGNLISTVVDSVLNKHKKDISIVFEDPQIPDNKIRVSLIPKGVSLIDNARFRNQRTMGEMIDSVVNDYIAIKNAYFQKDNIGQVRGQLRSISGVSHNATIFFNICSGPSSFTSRGETCNPTDRGAVKGVQVWIREEYNGRPFFIRFKTENSAREESLISISSTLNAVLESEMDSQGNLDHETVSEAVIKDLREAGRPVKDLFGDIAEGLEERIIGGEPSE
ncbi:MAG: hypothetical protein J4432_01055 [DPANN group archaeon]|nr:hypothetical protein [DPANN group archaeon]